MPQTTRTVPPTMAPFVPPVVTVPKTTPTTTPKIFLQTTACWWCIPTSKAAEPSTRAPMVTFQPIEVITQRPMPTRPKPWWENFEQPTMPPTTTIDPNSPEGQLLYYLAIASGRIVPPPLRNNQIGQANIYDNPSGSNPLAGMNPGNMQNPYGNQPSTMAYTEPPMPARTVRDENGGWMDARLYELLRTTTRPPTTTTKATTTTPIFLPSFDVNKPIENGVFISEEMLAELNNPNRTGPPPIFTRGTTTMSAAEKNLLAEIARIRQIIDQGNAPVVDIPDPNKRKPCSQPKKFPSFLTRLTTGNEFSATFKCERSPLFGGRVTLEEMPESYSARNDGRQPGPTVGLSALNGQAVSTPVNPSAVFAEERSSLSRNKRQISNFNVDQFVPVPGMGVMNQGMPPNEGPPPPDMPLQMGNVGPDGEILESVDPWAGFGSVNANAGGGANIYGSFDSFGNYIPPPMPSVGGNVNGNVGMGVGFGGSPTTTQRNFGFDGFVETTPKQQTCSKDGVWEGEINCTPSNAEWNNAKMKEPTKKMDIFVMCIDQANQAKYYIISNSDGFASFDFPQGLTSDCYISYMSMVKNATVNVTIEDYYDKDCNASAISIYGHNQAAFFGGVKNLEFPQIAEICGDDFEEISSLTFDGGFFGWVHFEGKRYSEGANVEFYLIEPNQATTTKATTARNSVFSL